MYVIPDLALFRSKEEFLEAQRKGWQQIKGEIAHSADSYFLCYQRAGVTNATGTAKTFPIASLKIVFVDLNPADIGGLACTQEGNGVFVYLRFCMRIFRMNSRA